jgi:hypothetical protein
MEFRTLISRLPEGSGATSAAVAELAAPATEKYETVTTEEQLRSVAERIAAQRSQQRTAGGARCAESAGASVGGSRHRSDRA